MAATTNESPLAGALTNEGGEPPVQMTMTKQTNASNGNDAGMRLDMNEIMGFKRT